MLSLALRLALVATPVLSEADLKIVERLAWRAGVPRGTVESLSTDVTGDGAPDVVLVTRTADRLVLFVAEGPVSPVGRWWRVDLHRGTGAGELCIPASAARSTSRTTGWSRTPWSATGKGQEPVLRRTAAQFACKQEAVRRCTSFSMGATSAPGPGAFRPARLHHRVDPCPPSSPSPRQTRSES